MSFRPVYLAIIDNALDGWGSPPETFPPDVRAAYVTALRDPAHAHAICEEYRAAAGLDRRHDQADRDAARKIRCPVLAAPVLWSGEMKLRVPRNGTMARDMLCY